MNMPLILWGKHPQFSGGQWQRLDKPQTESSLEAIRADGWEITQLMPGVPPPAIQKPASAPFIKDDLFSQYV